MADRSRRDRKDKIDKLAALKRARAGEKRVFEDEDVDIYDEVSEEQYKSIVKGRLQRDDFVVDDGAEGYVDNGMDDWSSGDQDMADSEEERETRRSKKSKSKVKDAKPKPKAKPPPPPAADISAYRPVISAEREDDFMANILQDLDSAPEEAPKRPTRKRKVSSDFDYVDSSSPIRSGRAADTFSDPFDDVSAPPSSDDFIMSPAKKPRTGGGVTPEVDRFGHMDVQSGHTSETYSGDEASFDDINMDEFMDVEDELDIKPKIEKESPKKVPKVKPSGKPAWLSTYEALSASTPENQGTLGSNTASIKPSNISALEEDGSLRFFWLDCMEERGKLYFTGKLKDKNSGAWVSCCVTVEGLERNLFILPWDTRRTVDADGNIHPTDVVPEYEDLYDDFDQLRRANGIKSFKAKEVKRKYAFGEEEVPREERTWMKVLYSFEDPELLATTWSANIRRIFGTNTSAFEALVLKRRIMGPCWLQIKNPSVDFKGVSWCKFEATVSDPKDINPFSDNDDSAPTELPPLNIISLAVRSVVNHNENNREVVCVSARTWHNISIDDPKPPQELPCTVQTYVRPLGKSFPPGFEKKARESSKGGITPISHERSLLNSLLAAIYKADPDVIVGHDFLGADLDVLLQRLKMLKCDHWSRLSRFRRSRWPNIGKQGRNISFLSGRLLCDLSSDGAKSMISSTTWSMTEMCKTHLNNDREDIDPEDFYSYFDNSTADRLLTFVRHCELDAHYQMAIASRVQILPLTKQLTNLAGNSWNKTLNGGRAERNEYILLHEFHRLKYICPDKAKPWSKKAEKTEDVVEQGGKVIKNKRDKYKGGLVLDPKRGLHDKFILVMDFNSLYPSIIQEYNIDFTTIDPVDRPDQDNEILEPPAPGQEQGVLPRLIATLVNRRRQVKSLMKDKNIDHAKLLQYDIKQQALKLTANSMYGCLGFEFSRFYARPLAALTTYKGRQILQHTKELAESLSLDVVYGDTDSVFVNSNATNLADALKVSNEFKKAVNDCYKLLEIDLDGVFQRLLLLQKKKYAALKIEDAGRTSVEVKGLDMKRREYCALSKEVSQFVLNQILSGEAIDTVVENIHEYLSQLGQDIRGGKKPLEDFIIHKRLGKNPEDYPDAKSQPHVQVALRQKAKGDSSARIGSVVSYVFCLPEGEEGTKLTQAEKARHPEELRKADNAFKIDFEHYISNQILPPVERLCDPIDGTDKTRLAECLGLDPAKYRTTFVTTFEDHAFSSLDSQISDQQRFKDAAPFRVRCQKCEVQAAYKGPFEDNATISHTAPAKGPKCSSCEAPLGIPSLQFQLDLQIREYISKYYEHWAVCRDPTCGNRSRTVRMRGNSSIAWCIRPGCGNEVAYEYTDATLYMQLRYFASLFDPKHLVEIAPTAHQMAITELVRQNSDFYDAMASTVEKYLELSAQRYVDLADVFSFMKV